jgi:hypothetical protein
LVFSIFRLGLAGGTFSGKCVGISDGDTIPAMKDGTAIGRIKTYDIMARREKQAAHITKTGTSITKASLNRELAFLKTMFNLAVELITWVDEFLKPILTLVIATGMRKNEIQNLK